MVSGEKYVYITINRSQFRYPFPSCDHGIKKHDGLESLKSFYELSRYKTGIYIKKVYLCLSACVAGLVHSFLTKERNNSLNIDGLIHSRVT